MTMRLDSTRPRRSTGRTRPVLAVTSLAVITALATGPGLLSAAPAGAAPTRPHPPGTTSTRSVVPPGQLRSGAEVIAPGRTPKLRLTAAATAGRPVTLAKADNSDRQRWQFRTLGGALTVRVQGGNLCLTANRAGTVSTATCKTDRAMQWRRVPRANNSYGLLNLGTRTVLTVAGRRDRVSVARQHPRWRDQLWTAGGLGAPSDTPSCTAPKLTVRALSNRSATPVPRGVTGAAGAAAADLAELPGAGTIAKYLLKLLGEGAAVYLEDWGLDEFAGWILPILGVGQDGPKLDPGEVDRRFDAIDTKLHDIQVQQYQDCQAILATLAELKDVVDTGAYSDLAGDLDVSLLKTYQDDFDAIITALRANGGQVDALSPQLREAMADMISLGPNGLPHLIDRIDTAMATDPPGANGLISQYNRVLVDGLGYNPFRTHVFPAEFVRPAAAQQNYYAAMVAQATFLYANVSHLNFSYDGNTYTSDPDAIRTLASRAQSYIQNWTVQFANGPVALRAADGWVSRGQGLGIDNIPVGTLIDYRDPVHPRLWTEQGVGLRGDDPASSPAYCGSTAQFCYANQYDGAGHVVDTSLMAPTPSTLAGLVAAPRSSTPNDWTSMSGWRIPFAGDWNALQAGVTGGLGPYAAANQLPMIAAVPTASHYAGQDGSISTVPPVLANLGTADAPSYAVFSAGDPTKNVLSRQTPFTPDDQSDIAGRAVLVRESEPTTPPAPFTATSRPAPSRGTPEAADRRGSPTATPKTAPRRQEKAAAGATDFRPVTFSTPTECGSKQATYVVPDGVSSVKIDAVGGAGAAGRAVDGQVSGGVGGSVSQVVAVRPGNTLYVQVGGAGAVGSGINNVSQQYYNGGQGGIGGGGTGGLGVSGQSDMSNDGSQGWSGGGGGASGVSSTPACVQWLAVGGGGGGGGGGYIDTDTITSDDLYSPGPGGSGCPSGGGASCRAAQNGQAGGGAHGGTGGGSAPKAVGGSENGQGAGTLAGGKGGDGAYHDGGTWHRFWGGGGGGGGGAGYFGGGGGGGAGNKGAGGGGGGGASYGIPGGSTAPSYGVASSSAGGSVTITPIARTDAFRGSYSSPDPVVWGQSVNVTMTTPDDASGTVGFWQGNTSLGSVPIYHGIATLAIPSTALGLGDDNVFTGYSGDARYKSVGSFNEVEVIKGEPAPELTVMGFAPAPGKSPTSMTVQTPADYVGTVTFYGSVKGGCASPPAPGGKCLTLGQVQAKNGYAILTQPAVPLGVGTTSVYAVVAADDHYNQGQSNAVAVTLTSP